jgi:hypothetical protein
MTGLTTRSQSCHPTALCKHTARPPRPGCSASPPLSSIPLPAYGTGGVARRNRSPPPREPALQRGSRQAADGVVQENPIGRAAIARCISPVLGAAGQLSSMSLWRE